MAVRQRVPSSSDTRRIKTILKKVAEGEAQFISHKQYRRWFGRTDSAATNRLNEIWEEQVSDWLTPELHYIDLTDGYVLVRKDRQSDWLMAVTGTSGNRHAE